MMVNISIIMPVYNTGEILRKTIESILQQTYPYFELLLVDDGSTDKSGDICDEYALVDKRIKVWHKTNGGICDARNFGLSKCTGTYIAFCDHDDLFEPQLLEKAYEAAINSKADVVKFRYKEIGEAGEYTLESISQKDVTFDSLKQHLYYLNSIGYFVTVWSFLYRRDWLVATGALFDTKMKHGGEDFDFNTGLIPHVGKMTIIPDILYLHFIRGSLSTSAKMYEDVMLHFLDTQKMINDVAKEVGCDVSAQMNPFIKYYGQCILNFVSGAVKLRKSNAYIKKKILDFREYNIAKEHVSTSILFKSFLENPKETMLYMLNCLNLNVLIIILYKIVKR